MDAIRKLHVPGKMTLGLEFPLDNDWSAEGERKRKEANRPFGIPDIADHTKLVQLADQSGFAALWMREVPVYDPNFGDGAQLFDTLSYLGYLAGITQNILLGTAAIVLPLHPPLMLAKAAATLEHLSDGRLLLGVGLGDRPVEFLLFGIDFDSREELFRRNFAIVKEAWKETSHLGDYYPGVSNAIQVYPKPHHPIPWIIAGRARQSMEWITRHGQGWFNYPRSIRETQADRQAWCNALYDNDQAAKPYITAFHLNLLKNKEEGFTPHRFGGATGSKHLTELLKKYEEVGVNHLALHLRHSETPVSEAIQQIGEEVLPHFI